MKKKGTSPENVRLLVDWQKDVKSGKLKPNAAGKALMMLDAHPALKEEWIRMLAGEDGEDFELANAVKESYDFMLNYKNKGAPGSAKQISDMHQRMASVYTPTRDAQRRRDKK